MTVIGAISGLLGVVVGFVIARERSARQDVKLWATLRTCIHNTAPPTIAELDVSPPP